MEKNIGKVVKVSIPGTTEAEILYSNQIEFQIQLEDQFITLLLEQDEMTAQIHKDDIVEIKRQLISGKEFVDIKKVSVIDDE